MSGNSSNNNATCTTDFNLIFVFVLAHIVFCSLLVSVFCNPGKLIEWIGVCGFLFSIPGGYLIGAFFKSNPQRDSCSDRMKTRFPHPPAITIMVTAFVMILFTLTTGSLIKKYEGEKSKANQQQTQTSELLQDSEDSRKIARKEEVRADSMEFSIPQNWINEALYRVDKILSDFDKTTKLVIVRFLDSSDSKPICGAKVQFQVIDTVGAIVLDTVSTSDQDGQIRLHIPLAFKDFYFYTFLKEGLVPREQVQTVSEIPPIWRIKLRRMEKDELQDR